MQFRQYNDLSLLIVSIGVVFYIISNYHSIRNIPNGCHGYERPPHSFPGSVDKRGREMLIVRLCILQMNKKTNNEYINKTTE